MTTSDVERFIGSRVREERERRGWSQIEFGRRMGEKGFAMKSNAVSRLEAGTRPTLVAEVYAAAEVFGLPVARLLPDEGEDWRDPESPANRSYALQRAAVAHVLDAVQEGVEQLRDVVDRQRDVYVPWNGGAPERMPTFTTLPEPTPEDVERWNAAADDEGGTRG